MNFVMFDTIAVMVKTAKCHTHHCKGRILIGTGSEKCIAPIL
jgi:hypothetical protein